MGMVKYKPVFRKRADSTSAVIYHLKRLVIFYMTTKKLLDPQRPLLKFISVKGIILFAYWQSLLLALLDQECSIFQETRQTLFPVV